jgi:hypothetical protein
MTSTALVKLPRNSPPSPKTNCLRRGSQSVESGSSWDVEGVEEILTCILVLLAKVDGADNGCTAALGNVVTGILGEAVTGVFGEAVTGVLGVAVVLGDVVLGDVVLGDAILGWLIFGRLIIGDVVIRDVIILGVRTVILGVAIVVNADPIELVLEHGQDAANVVKHGIDGLVTALTAHLPIAFFADELSRKCRLALGVGHVVDFPQGRGDRLRLRLRLGLTRVFASTGTWAFQVAVDGGLLESKKLYMGCCNPLKVAQGLLSELLGMVGEIVGGSQAPEEVRRDEETFN